jgi:phosphate transport system protein
MTIHLKNDLDTLHRDVLSMCAKVEEMVHRAVDSLSAPDVDNARKLAEEDNEIDAWDVRIEESCLRTLALHQPVAIDLRRIATVMKIVGELERVADLAVHIAERSCSLIGLSQVVVPDKLKQMAEIAVEMLHSSIDAYVQLNSALARNVCARDNTVDDLNRDVIDELERVMAASAEQVPPALHLFSASRHIERVADHATNIAEDVVYLVEGEIIRHRSPSEVSSDAQGE